MTKISVWDNTVGICIATTQLQGSVILTFCLVLGPHPWSDFDIFPPQFQKSHAAGVALGLSALFLLVRGSANQCHLFEKMTAEALHRLQLIQNQYLLKWAMADDVM